MMGAKVGSGKVTLFHQEARGGLTYRIPALLYLPPESTFLAFAEERSTPSDKDAKFLVMRRGKKHGASVQWGPLEPLTTATLPGHRTMNPCPVYERKSGTVFLFFICVESHVSERHQIWTGRNAARLCHVCSRDGGRTWSQTSDLTEQVIGKDLRNWATFAVGPGHGLQLGSGRLVVPAYAYYIHRRCFSQSLFPWTKPRSLTFYSDDGGQSWARGRLVESLQTTECQVAELLRPDGGPVLYLNARSQSRYRYRGEALSLDGGEQFGASAPCRELSEPPGGCQGSVVSISPARSSTSGEDAESWLVFSHPTSRHKRLDLGIYLNTSPLERGSWKAPWVIHHGPSGYSDLAVCEEKTPLLLGCLFECGLSSPYEEIAFQLFTSV